MAPHAKNAGSCPRAAECSSATPPSARPSPALRRRAQLRPACACGCGRRACRGGCFFFGFGCSPSTSPATAGRPRRPRRPPRPAARRRSRTRRLLAERRRAADGCARGCARLGRLPSGSAPLGLGPRALGRRRLGLGVGAPRLGVSASGAPPLTLAAGFCFRFRPPRVPRRVFRFGVVRLGGTPRSPSRPAPPARRRLVVDRLPRRRSSSATAPRHRILGDGAPPSSFAGVFCGRWRASAARPRPRR